MEEAKHDTRSGLLKCGLLSEMSDWIVILNVVTSPACNDPSISLRTLFISNVYLQGVFAHYMKYNTHSTGHSFNPPTH